MNIFDIKKSLEGISFEDYTIEKILEFKNYDVLKKSNNNFKFFIHSNLEPDYKLKCKKSKETFWIECKYCSTKNLQLTFITIKKEQYFRYKKLKEPVFYLYGFGDTPEKIEKLFLIPIEKMFHKKIFIKYLLNFEIPIKQIKNFNELIKLTS